MIDVKNFEESNVRIFGRSAPEIGYYARTTTKGDEIDMVNSYIEHIVSKYKKLKKGRVAIFIEPQIDTGYPDIVIVEYSGVPKIAWADSRRNLTTTEMKILFQVYKQKNASLSDLNELLGFSPEEIKKSFVHLAACNLIHLSKSEMYARNTQLQAFCNVKKVIAIEAKIDKWSEAILQASKNSWFSTESYILLNKTHCNEAIINKCKEHGVGIILVNGSIKHVLKSTKRQFPISYTSLLFNEWIQRANELEAHK
ncbi:hypothetical protein LJC27_04430 [Christensenellaceae bacterium OttesenSCG-928-M15]|nr:hypothetical protein [Christensenellaceae bacterium OttesenSCG-928-M15]